MQVKHQINFSLIPPADANTRSQCTMYAKVDDAFSLGKNLIVPPFLNGNISIYAVCFGRPLQTPQAQSAISSIGKRDTELTHHLTVAATYEATLKTAIEKYGATKPFLMVNFRYAETSIPGKYVFPVTTANGSYGKEPKLIGYEDNNRIWPPYTFYLVIDEPKK